MDDEQLIDILLYTGEGASLDYKVQQYPHDGATPEAKGELLKDILAFANAWRQENAYILIGVSDSRELIGLDKDLDDSRLQQFINGKTNRPIHFSYRSITYKKVKLGLYTIEVQERPIYARQGYGKVSADTVYVRRGSSTDTAKPDEIAKMGAKFIESQARIPKLSLKILRDDDNTIEQLSFEYNNLSIENQINLPDLKEKPQSYNPLHPLEFNFISALSRLNRDYYRELAEWAQESNGTTSFRLQLTNTGTSFAADVKIYLSVPATEDLKLINEDDIKPKPKRRLMPSEFSYNNLFTSNSTQSSAYISEEKDFITAIFSFKKIQSGETLTTDYICLSRPPQSLTSLNIKILSDQLMEPLSLTIPVTIIENKVAITFQDLENM